MEKTYQIPNKRGKVVKFNFNVAQRLFFDTPSNKIVCVKARQKGISSAKLAVDQAQCLIRENHNRILLSAEGDATKRLFSRAKFYFDNIKLPKQFLPNLLNDSAGMLKWENNSTYFIGTAGQKAVGRGDTLHGAHLSEADFYPDLNYIMTGLEESVALGGDITIETTPNGFGSQVHQRYLAAKSGDNEYSALFIPWFIDGEYSLENLTKEELEQHNEFVQSLAKEKIKLTKDERELIEKAKNIFNMEISEGQLKWRRVKIKSKGDVFFQEYPEDDVSCWLHSGRAVFTEITLEPKIELDKKSLFYGGVDGAEGRQGADNHCFVAISDSGYVAYEYVSNEPIEIFWDKVEDFCKKFTTNLLIENNGVGMAHVGEARRRGLAHQEHKTTGANRSALFADLEIAYRSQELIETYQEAKDEALAMVWKQMTGGAQRPDHVDGMHDDRVMARAIAWRFMQGGEINVT